MVGLYRSNNNDIKSFISSLDHFLEQHSNNVYCIIAGDININICDQNLSNVYLNTMASYEFVYCINEYTRVTNSTQSCIDHIFTRNIDISTIEAFILKCVVTDHYATTISLDIPLNSEVKKNVRKKIQRKINKNKF